MDEDEASVLFSFSWVSSFYPVALGSDAILSILSILSFALIPSRRYTRPPSPAYYGVMVSICG